MEARDIVGRVLDRSFELQGEAVLENAIDSKKSISGWTMIRMDKERQLTISVFVATDRVDVEWFNRPGRNAGLLLEDADLFHLAMTDWTGRSWTAASFYPSTITTIGKGVRITGHLRELRRALEPPIDGVQGLILYFPGRPTIPVNRMVTVTRQVEGREHSGYDSGLVEFTSAGYQVRVEPDTNHFMLSLWRDDRSLHARLAERASEALRFVLGLDLDWVVMESADNDGSTLVIRSGQEPAGNRRASPPLRLTSGDGEGRVWTIFDKYFTHTLEGAEAMVHPISQRIGSIIRSEATVFEETISSLTRAVEAIVKSIDVQDALLAVSAPDIESATRAIEGLGIQDHVKKRMLGAINTLRTARAADRLHILSEKDLVDREGVKAWKRRRHRVAHGEGFDLDQSAISDRNRLRVLVHRLVFLSIGYHGPYTDYGSIGFPTREHGAPAKPRS